MQEARITTETLHTNVNIPRNEKLPGEIVSMVHQQSADFGEATFPVTHPIPAVSLGHEYLLSPERTPEEIDAVLEGQLQGYQFHFIEPEDSIIAADFGIEQRQRPRTARFLGYVALFNEYDEVVQAHKAKLAEAEILRDQLRGEINEKVRNHEWKKGRGEKARRQNEQIYQTTIQPHNGSVASLTTIQRMIASKYVREQFSPYNPENDFSLTPESANEIVNNACSISEARDDVINFIEGVVRYLGEEKSSMRASEYPYKSSAGLVRNSEDCKVLGAAIKLALAKQEDGTDRLVQSLGNLGSAFIRQSIQNAQMRSRKTAEFGETYPILDNVYDFLTTILTINDPKYSEHIPAFLDMLLANSLSSTATEKELHQFVRRFRSSAAELYRRHTNTIVSALPMSSVHPNSIPDEILEFIRSDVNRLFTGFTNNLPPSLTAQSAPWRDSNVIAAFLTKFDDFNTRSSKNTIEQLQVYPFMMYQNLPLIFFGYNLFSDAGITVDLRMTADSSNRNIIEQSAHVDIDSQTPAIEQEIRRKLKKAGQYQLTHRSFSERLREISGNIGNFSDRQLLLEYSIFHLNESHKFTKEQIDTLSRENSQLWFNILNTSKWFISPRGDQYIEELDPELHTNEISSITFRIDPRFPREHVVELLFAGLQRPIRISLDTREQIVDENRNPVHLDQHFMLGISNLLLKRLHFITSGALAETADRDRQGLLGGNLNLLYKRAHYRVYTDPRITMTSKSALVHAEEILELYGIDIWEETRRRRRIGVLAPNEYLTFVRESEPEVKSDTPEPNTIVYIPELAILNDSI